MAELPPPITRETVQSLYQKGIEATIIKSAGRITEITEGSPISAIEEGLAVIAGGIIDEINSLPSKLEQSRLTLFGLEKQEGSPAVGTIRVNLDGSYLETFQLPLGFPLSIGGVVFETVETVTIPSYEASGTAGIIASTPGETGNLPSNTPVSFAPISKVSSIVLIEPTQGGIGEESDAEFQQRIYGELRRRDSLISEDDFEAETIDQLGDGATALAVGELRPDLVSFAPGYVAVFGLNPDGSPLNISQIAQLQEQLSRKAAMATITVSSLETFELDIYVYAQFEGNSSAIAEEVKQVVNLYLKPGNLPPGDQILNKAIEFQIQNIEGIVQGLVTVTINGLEQPQSMPSPWAIGLLFNLTIELINSTGDSFLF